MGVVGDCRIHWEQDWEFGIQWGIEPCGDHLYYGFMFSLDGIKINWTKIQLEYNWIFYPWFIESNSGISSFQWLSSIDLIIMLL